MTSQDRRLRTEKRCGIRMDRGIYSGDFLMKLSRVLSGFGVLGLMLALLSIPTFAQEGNENESGALSPLDRAALEKAKVERDLKEMEVIGKAFEALAEFEKPEISGDSPILPTLALLKAAKRISQSICDDIGSRFDSTSRLLIVQDRTVFKEAERFIVNQYLLDQISNEVKNVEDEWHDVETSIETTLEDDLRVSPTSVALGIGIASEFVSIIRPKVQIKSVATKVSVSHIANHLFKCLGGEGTDQIMLLSNVFPIDKTALDTAIESVSNAKALSARIDRVIADTSGLLALDSTDISESSNKDLLELKSTAEKLKAEHLSTLNYFSDIASDNSKVVPQTLRLIDFISDGENDNAKRAILTLDLMAQGGDIFTKTTAFTNRIFFSGGLAIDYQLIMVTDGTIAKIGTESDIETISIKAKNFENLGDVLSDDGDE